MPSGGGEKPHEELQLSVISSEEAELSVESGDEREREEDDEDKSHAIVNRSSAMDARKENRVSKS